MSVTMQIKHRVDLQKPQQIMQIGTLINQGDHEAHAFVLEVYDNGTAASLESYSVIGAFARADGNIVRLGGRISGNVVTVELTSACYSVQGYCMVSIKLTGEQTRTLYKATGSVDKEAEGDIVTNEQYTAFDALVEEIVRDYLAANPPQTKESDPTVPAWAKQPNKPAYTAAEVGLGNVDNVRQYSAQNQPPYPVTSVNGQTGAVRVDAGSVGLGSVDNVRQYSANNPPPYPVTRVNGMTGDVLIEIKGGDGGIAVETDPTVPAWAKQPNQPTYTAADVGLGNVDNVRQYSASNPPPYPVTSVNGQTGAVTIEAGGGDADSLGGTAASVYKDFITRKNRTVTVNSSFVSSGSITAETVGGMLKVGGYLQTKVAHAGDGYTTNIICTINGVKVNGNMYAVMIDHATGKAYNILLMTSGSNSVVQLESSSYALPKSTWLNFGIIGTIA